MVIKSLTITEDAYGTLKRLKYENESFSDVILRIGREKTNVLDRYFGICKMSEGEAQNLFTSIKENRRQNEKQYQEKQKRLRMLKQ